MEIQISGSFSREIVDELRASLVGPTVSLQSGFAGERILRIIGTLSQSQIERIRLFLVRLLGGDQIGRIMIKKGSIEIVNLPAKQIEAVRHLVNDLSEILKA